MVRKTSLLVLWRPIGSCFLAACLVLLAARPFRGGEEDAEKEGEKDSKEPASASKEDSSTEPQDPDYQFIKESLKDFIHGKITFDKKGAVTIVYDFSKKDEEFQDDFRPPISAKVAALFRWSIHEEDWYTDPGIRISDRGASFLNLWFKDDFEATMELQNAIGWTKGQIAAVVFQNKGGSAIGNNFGGQCAVFKNGAFSGGVPPVTDQLPFKDKAKCTLKVKGGTYEALRNGKARKTAKYAEKSFGSGRIGFIWGGKVAGVINSLTIKGTLDCPATVKDMKKGPGK